MKKNIVIVDVDVDFKKLVSRVKSPFGGYVSLEYYYDVGDETFAELEKSNVLFSQFGDRSVLDVLGDAKPFDGISTGQASLAKKLIDGREDRDGHSSKMKDVFDSVGGAERVLRICHTVNLFRQDGGGVRMFCRSFYLDPETLEQTDACAGPGLIPEVAPGAKPVETAQRLFDFLAIRKNMHQKAETSITYRVEALSPARDFDLSTKTIAADLGFEEAFQTAKDWLKSKRASGELVVKDEIGVFATNYGDKRKPGARTDGVMRFKDMRASGNPLGDKSDVVLDRKKLTVRKSQALTLFSIVPSVTRINQYILSESESDSAFIEFAAHMLDGCGW